jgi:hypothetical protein
MDWRQISRNLPLGNLSPALFSLIPELKTAKKQPIDAALTPAYYTRSFWINRGHYH